MKAFRKGHGCDRCEHETDKVHGFKHPGDTSRSTYLCLPCVELAATGWIGTGGVDPLMERALEVLEGGTR